MRPSLASVTQASRTLSLTALIGALITISACGSGALTEGGIDDFTSIDTTVVSSESSISGAGSLVFTQPMESVASGKNFTLSLSLPQSGTVTLHSYSTQSLGSGIDVRMTRGGATLSVGINTGSGWIDVSPSFSSIDASQEFTVSFDIHNDESPVHILAWNTDGTTEASALFNSEDDASLTGQGQGNFWGLTLTDGSVVTQAFASEPRFEE